MSKTFENIRILWGLVSEVIRKVYGGDRLAKRREAFERLSKSTELSMEDWANVKEDLLNRWKGRSI